MPSDLPPPPAVSAAELEVLKVLWKCADAGGTVRDVEAELKKKKKTWAYTTILTLLSRLRAKGYASQEREPAEPLRPSRAAHRFRAAISREQLLGNGLADLANRICDGTATPLVQALVKSKKLSATDIADLRRMLDELDEKE